MFHTDNEIKKNNFNNISNVKTDFKIIFFIFNIIGNIFFHFKNMRF